MYTAAGGKKMTNEGEKDVTMVAGTTEIVQTSWQTVDIIRPLSSVRQICLQGNKVLFGAQGGEETPFGIEDNVYVLDLWLPPSPPRGFGRRILQAFLFCRHQAILSNRRMSWRTCRRTSWEMMMRMSLRKAMT